MAKKVNRLRNADRLAGFALRASRRTSIGVDERSKGYLPRTTAFRAAARVGSPRLQGIDMRSVFASMGPVLRRVALLSIFGLAALLAGATATSATPIQIYGVWHCGSNLCGWSTIRDMTEFDSKNHWLIDRGDGSPSVNLVILSFVNPLKLLHLTNDTQTSEGVPIGITPAIVGYFTARKIRVMLSIGGSTYANDWDEALRTNPAQLGINAAQLARRLGVGIEIDYENDESPDLTGLQKFIRAYRSILPYDATGTNPAARLTIDLALGDDYLIPLTQYATSNWLTTSNPVLDYANAMVAFEQADASVAEAGWQEHIDGKPPIPPLAPAKFTGSLFIVARNNLPPECVNFNVSLQSATGKFVQSVAPRGAGVTNGMLGYMFWAAECSGSRSLCTTPPSTCEGGVGVGAKTLNIPVPMPPLRQN
jgi:hypothetical protein